MWKMTTWVSPPPYMSVSSDLPSLHQEHGEKPSKTFIWKPQRTLWLGSVMSFLSPKMYISPIYYSLLCEYGLVWHFATNVSMLLVIFLFHLIVDVLSNRYTPYFQRNYPFYHCSQVCTHKASTAPCVPANQILTSRCRLKNALKKIIWKEKVTLKDLTRVQCKQS